MKNAPVEVEVILLTLVDAWCITFLEAEEDPAFIGSSERFWVRSHHKHPEKKVLNPLLSANYPEAPYDITILDKRSFPEWFERMRAISSPLKAQQLKGVNIAKLHPACDLKRSITKRMEISMPRLKETVYFIVNPMAGNGEG
ncbi:hypothetical protein [Peribacillus frigoritolerans]|uniref:hypothetical protein n=1 Tax=Peribacillus frigoritolerans TaxID=450367 RepID=UPI003800B1BD